MYITLYAIPIGIQRSQAQFKELISVALCHVITVNPSRQSQMKTQIVNKPSPSATTADLLHQTLCHGQQQYQYQHHTIHSAHRHQGENQSSNAGKRENQAGMGLWQGRLPCCWRHWLVFCLSCSMEVRDIVWFSIPMYIHFLITYALKDIFWLSVYFAY